MSTAAEEKRSLLNYIAKQLAVKYGLDRATNIMKSLEQKTMNAGTKPTATTSAVPLQGDNDKIDWSRIDTGIEYEGKKIVLPGEPAQMPLDTAIKTLERVRESEAQTFDTTEIIKGLPWDAAVAIYKAMLELYGVTMPETMRSWFGDRDPTFLTVKIGPEATDIVQIPQGLIGLPGMGQPVHFGIHKDFAFIKGTVHKKDRARLVQIAVLARQIMKSDSIYKGKAIMLTVTDKGEIDINQQPTFFDVRNVTENDMIHNKVTRALIETSILAPIKHSAACRRHNIPLKRGVLLEGRYGTGKTLTARVAASVAMNHGWTFIVLDKPNGLAAALRTAVTYEPCVVFAEDIDRFGDREKDSVNDLVNLIDGLVPASSAIMTVLTTNFIERIDKALLRPGRFDAVITIDAPDAETVSRLVRHYGGKALPADVDVVPVGEILAGQIPATVAEVVKRSKLSMLTEGRETLTAADLETAAHGMKRHLSLLDDPAPSRSVAEELYDAIVSATAKAADAVAQAREPEDYIERFDQIANYCS